MFILDLPYVSEFLLKTIERNNFKVIDTPASKQVTSGRALNLISEEEAVRILKEDPQTPLYTNSENSIAWVTENLSFTRLPDHIQIFKDKVRFRELVKDIFPDFVFKSVDLHNLPSYQPEEKDYPFVLKPAVGFFSLGVHIIHDRSQWDNAVNEITGKDMQTIYPKEVIDNSVFIIEEYIEGEEYAVDCYFDAKGYPVILNILHHKFSSGTDTSDRVYSTSAEIIRNNLKQTEQFLSMIGKKAGLMNFPLHVELRIDNDGRIMPIEVNPLRFGGWCTTADLAFHAYGINSYEYFMKSKKPDWDKVFEEKKGKIYSIIILNNNSGIDAERITGFNYDLFKSDLENLIEMRKLSIKEYPVFGFAFTETSKDNEKELEKILVSDLKRYILT